MGANLSQPFQHQAIDSCHTIPCTKCHLSYYKFSAEYSADPMGLRTKREHWQGHLWNASRELPPSLRCEAVSWPRLWVWHRQLWLPTMPQQDDCRCVLLSCIPTICAVSYAVFHNYSRVFSLKSNGHSAVLVPAALPRTRRSVGPKMRCSPAALRRPQVG